MLQIGGGFFAGGNRIFDRDWTAPQASDLGKDEPHPVARFHSRAQFGEDLRVDWILRGNEAFEIVGVAIRAVAGT